MARPGRWWRRWAAALALLALALPAQAFDLQGHRGARGLWPENSLPAFAAALKLGVTTLELDVGVTRDGVVVVHHDIDLNPDTTRDAQGQWLRAPTPALHALTCAQLQDFDIGRLRPGSRYASTFAQQQPVDGTRIPRLAEVFELVRRTGDERVRVAIEIKLRPDAPDKTLPPEAFAEAVLREVRAAGMAARVQILSFDWRALQAVQRLAPGLPTVYLSTQQAWNDNIGAARSDDSPWTAGVRWRDHGSVPAMVHAAGGQVWSAHHGDLTATLVAQAHALGLQVLAWTVNDAALLRRMIDIGVDGVVTDRPDIAQAVLRERGIEPR